jgi:hypothetical protein
MKQIPLRIYLLRYLVIRAAMGTLTTTIYEIVIKLVKLQTDYRYPNSHFFPSLCNALQLFLILVCSIFKYLLPIL